MNEQPIIDPTREKILSLAAETQFTPNGIVSRTLLRTPAVRVVLFGFAAGQELSEHTSVHHALVQILSGECDFPTNGQNHRLKAGDVLYMPPGLRHAVQATKDFSMLLTLINVNADACVPSLESVTRINVADSARASAVVANRGHLLARIFPIGLVSEESFVGQCQRSTRCSRS